MTLNGAMALILRYFAEFGSLLRAHNVKVDDLPSISSFKYVKKYTN